MYQVLIVDDEPVIRNGIKAFIDWEKEGMLARADCANGVEALNALEGSPADILITDIKMPLMGGIELMKKALELYPGVKVIIVSSYSDFEYAREGLKLGAVDYLLKPTLETEELLAVLRRCIGMLEEEKRKESELNRYHSDAVYRERKKLEQEIKRQMVQEQEAAPEFPGAPGWMRQAMGCAYLMLDGSEELGENHGILHVQLLLEELQESFYKTADQGVALIVSESSLFLLLPDGDKGSEGLLRAWKQSVQEEMGISVSLGYGTVSGAGDIRQGFANSRSACERRFVEGLGGFYPAAANPGEYQKQTAGQPPDWAELAENIYGRRSVTSVMGRLHERWAGGRLSPEQIKQEACSLLTEVFQSYADSGMLLPERLDLLRHAEALDRLEAVLVRQLEELGRLSSAKLTDKGYGGQLITKALDYMTAHFKEDITLQSTADVVHISKSYFSLLFKKQTGHNFIDYLIELRIREAKRLLSIGESRIYEVAEAAGFNDVKYFSKLFKKITGLTPMEYREKHTALEA